MIALFGSKFKIMSKHNNCISIDSWLYFKVSSVVCSCLVKLRNAIEDAFADKVLNPARDNQINNHNNNNTTSAEGSIWSSAIDIIELLVYDPSNDIKENKMSFSSRISESKSSVDSWQCRHCKKNNLSTVRNCSSCKKAYEDTSTVKDVRKLKSNEDIMVSKSSNNPNARPGDWICGNCQMNNFSRRDKCFSCQAPKSK